jgi:hypothetical protein
MRQVGWDQYAGSSFFVNFQVGLARALERTERRLQHFLTDRELETLLGVQGVIRRLVPPPESHVSALRPPSLGTRTVMPCSVLFLRSAS